MKYRKEIVFESVYAMASVIMVFFMIGSIPQTSFAEISVDSYCQLSIQSMQQEMSNFQELIALANQYQDDPQALAQQEEIKRAEFNEANNDLFFSYGTTAEEYVTYMGKNGRAVKEYLDSNPDIKQKIDDLSAQIRALLEEYEALKGSTGTPAKPLP